MSSRLGTFAENLESDLVTFYLGYKFKKFQVHKALVCKSAAFFENAFNGPSRENYGSVMYLPEDSAEGFSMFLHWLYRSTVPEGETSSEDYLNNLYHLYFFSEKITQYELADKTIDRIQDIFRINKKKIDRSTLVLVYENTVQCSVLRRFCVFVMVYGYFQDWTKMANRREVNVLDAQTLSYLGELGVRKRICLRVHLNETKNAGKIDFSSIAMLKMSAAISQRAEDEEGNDYVKSEEWNESSQETSTFKLEDVRFDYGSHFDHKHLADHSFTESGSMVERYMAPEFRIYGNRKHKNTLIEAAWNE